MFDNITKYYDNFEILQALQAQEQVQADQKALNQIITEGDFIAKNGKVTFKKIYESGEHVRI